MRKKYPAHGTKYGYHWKRIIRNCIGWTHAQAKIDAEMRIIVRRRISTTNKHWEWEKVHIRIHKPTSQAKSQQQPTIKQILFYTRQNQNSLVCAKNWNLCKHEFLFSLSILDCCPPHLYTFIRIFINYAVCLISFCFHISKPLFIIRFSFSHLPSHRKLESDKPPFFVGSTEVLTKWNDGFHGK